MRFITLSLFATLLSAPAFAADLGTYRPGTPYNSSVAGGADVCESHCAGDAQCRGWNYVKPNPRAAGICEFLSSVSTPIASQISISGESQSAGAFSSRVSQGNTNTVRVGTQVAPQVAQRPQTVVVGQTASGRKIVRRVEPQRVVPQKASTRPIENMSLTEQQNRFRNAQAAGGQAAAQPQLPQGRALQPQLPQGRAPQRQIPQSRPPQQQAFAQPQRPIFRPILDAPTRQNLTPQFRQPQAPQGIAQPRQGQAYAPGHAAPQFQDPRVQGQNFQGQNFQGQNVQGQNVQGQNYQGQPFQGQGSQSPQGQAPQYTQQQAARRGSSRPPIGEPIQAPQKPVAPQPSTPGQRLAKMTAQLRSSAPPVLPTGQATGPVALSPEQARQSLFGSLNDDLRSSGIPTARAVQTQPVTEQPLDEVLAGG